MKKTSGVYMILYEKPSKIMQNNIEYHEKTIENHEKHHRGGYMILHDKHRKS